jgi:AcrR family transcriptional regulator
MSGLGPGPARSSVGGTRFRYIDRRGEVDTAVSGACRRPCVGRACRRRILEPATQGGSLIGDGFEPASGTRLIDLEITDPDALWYRVPQQARSRETLDRFLSAIEELLADRSFDELTIADIAARADRTIGSFYGRFADKDAALRSLHARYLDDDLPFLEEFLHPSNWPGKSLESILRRTIEVFVEAYRHPRPSFRPVIMRAATDEAFRTQCTEAAGVANRAWRRLIVSRVDEVTHPDPGYAADLCYRHLFAVLDHELLFGPMLPVGGTSDDQLIDDLTSSTLAVLGRADD